MTERRLTKKLLMDMIKHVEKHYKLEPIKKFDFTLEEISDAGAIKVMGDFKIIMKIYDDMEVLYCAAKLYISSSTELTHMIIPFYSDNGEPWRIDFNEEITLEQFEEFNHNVIEEFYGN